MPSTTPLPNWASSLGLPLPTSHDSAWALLEGLELHLNAILDAGGKTPNDTYVEKLSGEIESGLPILRVIWKRRCDFNIVNFPPLLDFAPGALSTRYFYRVAMGSLAAERKKWRTTTRGIENTVAVDAWWTPQRRQSSRLRTMEVGGAENAAANLIAAFGKRCHDDSADANGRRQKRGRQEAHDEEEYVPEVGSMDIDDPEGERNGSGEGQGGRAEEAGEGDEQEGDEEGETAASGRLAMRPLDKARRRAAERQGKTPATKAKRKPQAHNPPASENPKETDILVFLFASDDPAEDNRCMACWVHNVACFHKPGYACTPCAKVHGACNLPKDRVGSRSKEQTAAKVQAREDTQKKAREEAKREARRRGTLPVPAGSKCLAGTHNMVPEAKRQRLMPGSDNESDEEDGGAGHRDRSPTPAPHKYGPFLNHPSPEPSDTEGLTPPLRLGEAAPTSPEQDEPAASPADSTSLPSHAPLAPRQKRQLLPVTDAKLQLLDQLEQALLELNIGRRK
ncbi:hypothetical protein CONPUDRAFT_152011 [Coniophora puteana RWD-64-598 SS2]|uniref:Uncharacterized protein n=1 Tax=Coniophora puteana (strain RWD-64-598) TaxID=741705 RepID=A0A5M3MW44_CONPW|nr:uncharacterized protein CONPUDRAFT_152011 [Coniophora puteana RWD-64-598 SS2]EIW82954.1 hypothetical protein CONPUDRAFT_152011 [Coniophora puteana RWD-64-598 SS2]